MLLRQPASPDQPPRPPGHSSATGESAGRAQTQQSLAPWPVRRGQRCPPWQARAEGRPLLFHNPGGVVGFDSFGKFPSIHLVSACHLKAKTAGLSGSSFHSNRPRSRPSPAATRGQLWDRNATGRPAGGQDGLRLGFGDATPAPTPAV